MIIDAIFVGMAFYFTFPLLTGYAAHHYGRKFWVWFAIGCLLPVVSFIIIVSLIIWDEKTTPRHKLSRREHLESDEMVQELVQELKKNPAPQKPYTPGLPSEWMH